MEIKNIWPWFLGGVGVVVLSAGIFLIALPGQRNTAGIVRQHKIGDTTELVGISSGASDVEDTDTDEDIALPKVHVLIVTHSEESESYNRSEEMFESSRKVLVQFAEMLHDEGVAWNYQSDWTFLLAATQYDAGDASTNNKNFLQYFKEDLGFEIDPHAHETQYNYADVAYLISQLGVEPSGVVGGFVASPASESKLEYLQSTIHGNVYSYAWKPEVLWGGAVGGHQNESDLWVSGIWNPKDAEHFTEDGGNLPDVGGYYTTWEGLDALLAKDLDPGKIYTQAIFAGQRTLTDESIEAFRAQIEKRKSDKRIVWVGLTELISIWESEYHSESNILKYDGDVTSKGKGPK